MRDINRIEPFIEKLSKVWKLYPDLRFFQLVELIKSQLNVTDAFYIEDDETLKVIENMLKANGETDDKMLSTLLLPIEDRRL